MPLLAGFPHFLVKYIAFDKNPDNGHGTLARHLKPNERVRPLWDCFYRLFDSVSRLREVP